MSTPTDVFKHVKELDRRGEPAQALNLLRDHLRSGALDPTGIEKAGRHVRKVVAAGRVDVKPLRVLILGQVTTSWLLPALSAVAWGHNAVVSVAEGGYDTVLQDLAALPPDMAPEG